MAKPPEKDSYSALRSAGLLLAIPTLLIVSPLAGFFIGFWADRWLHSSPWFEIVGLVYRRSLEEEKRSEERKQGGNRRP
jgi:F0F1-type ATP synthase assembly protein I